MNRKNQIILIFGVIAILVAAFFIFRSQKNAKAEFEYTVSLRTQDKNAPLKNSGVIQMNINSLALNAPINKDGNAILKVPLSAKGKKAQIQMFVVGWRFASNLGVEYVVLNQDESTLIIRSDNTLSTFRGIVKDADNKPLEGATVTVSDLTSITNDKGQFQFSLPLEKQSNKQSVSVEKKGYSSRKVNVYPAINNNVRIVLEKNL